MRWVLTWNIIVCVPILFRQYFQWRCTLLILVVILILVITKYSGNECPLTGMHKKNWVWKLHWYQYFFHVDFCVYFCGDSCCENKIYMTRITSYTHTNSQQFDPLKMFFHRVFWPVFQGLHINSCVWRPLNPWYSQHAYCESPSGRSAEREFLHTEQPSIGYVGIRWEGLPSHPGTLEEGNRKYP